MANNYNPEAGVAVPSIWPGEPAGSAPAGFNAEPATAFNIEMRRLIGQLSKDYRQRVGLADALVHEPVLIILFLRESVGSRLLHRPL